MMDLLILTRYEEPKIKILTWEYPSLLCASTAKGAQAPSFELDDEMDI